MKRISFWHFLFYTIAWTGLFLQIPENLIDLPVIKTFTGCMTYLVPSIKTYAQISRTPNQTLIFFSIQWALVPIYVGILLKCFLREFPSAVRKTRAQTPVSPFLLVCILVIIATTLVLLPNDLSLDPRTVHAVSQWKRLMHKYQIVAGAMAVWLPIVFSICIFCIAGYASYFFLGKQRNDNFI